MPFVTFLEGTADIWSELGVALSSTTLWTNICKTVVFILLGFIFTKKKLLPDKTGTILTKFVMAVCLPCLAFCSFMTDFSVQGGIDAIVNFVGGFVIYILFIFLSKLIFIWVKDVQKRKVLAVLFAFGSTTFFAYPLITAIYGSSAGNNFNIMNVAYRVFLYSYAYLAIAGIGSKDENKEGDKENAGEGEKKANDKTSIKAILKKVFLNPIVIATFAGLILWLLQAIPGVAFVPKDWLSGGTSETLYAIWRFDVTLPWLYQTANTLGGLSSTIILFAIGCTLGGTNISEAAKDKYAWIWTALKVLVAPTIVLLLLCAIQGIARACGFEQLISTDTLNAAVITWMVPPATVAVGYCISFDKEKEMASHISLISTLGAVLGIVIWVIILTVIGTTGFFYTAA